MSEHDTEWTDYDDYDDYDPNVCPECGGGMTFVRDGVYCCANTNDCDYCLDTADLDAEGDSVS